MSALLWGTIFSQIGFFIRVFREWEKCPLLFLTYLDEQRQRGYHSENLYLWYYGFDEETYNFNAVLFVVYVERNFNQSQEESDTFMLSLCTIMLKVFLYIFSCYLNKFHWLRSKNLQTRPRFSRVNVNFTWKDVRDTWCGSTNGLAIILGLLNSNMLIPSYWNSDRNLYPVFLV